jgi:hypothetical protein
MLPKLLLQHKDADKGKDHLVEEDEEKNAEEEGGGE